MVKRGREPAPQELAWEVAVDRATVTSSTLRSSGLLGSGRQIEKCVSSTEVTVLSRVDDEIATDTPRAFPRLAGQELLFSTRLAASCPWLAQPCVLF